MGDGAGTKNKRIIHLEGLKRQNAVGDIQDRKETLGSFLFHCFLLPFGMVRFGAGCAFCKRRVWLWRTKGQGGAPQRKPKSGCSGLV